MNTSCGISSSFSGWRFDRRASPIARPAVVEASYDKPAAWRFSVDRRLNELVSLPIGWDGYRGKPVSRENAIFARNVIETICGHDLPAPQIVPGINGDLQLEWHTFYGDLELRIVRPNLVNAWFAEGKNDDGIETIFSNDFKVASVWLASITEKHLAAELAAA